MRNYVAVLRRPKVDCRVCPECGAEAGREPFCAGCGRNLASEQRLPSRREWEASHGVAPARGRLKPRRWIIAVALVAVAIAIGVGVALALAGQSSHERRRTAAFDLRAYKVPSGSMEPTLQVGARVIVEETTAPLRVGDIVVFHPPVQAEYGVCGPVAHTVTLGGAACSQPIPRESSVTFIKRIVAVAGDTIYIKEGHVYRNGAREADPYTRSCGESAECNFPTPITIPPGSYYLLGDNRGNAEDSRFWGAVPRSWIIGKVINDARGAPGLRGF
jgi:signal peptidase I